MGKSVKKAIYKDKGFAKQYYWRTIRRVQKQYLEKGKDIPHRRSIINDYDYCDYIFDAEYGDRSIWNYDKLRRK